jgi:UDP-N-acetylmuramoyl-L-alanyl-D-glutamate--2,6-diaminopimelate ligase
MSARSIRLRELLEGLDPTAVEGDTELSVLGLATDSRQVRPGDLFVALTGERVDGHRFLEQAAAQGAVAALVERPMPRGRLAALVRVARTRTALARASVRFFGEPGLALGVIGITGTKGKTTVSFLLESILRAAGARPGLIGTLGARLGQQHRSTDHTTPEAPELQALLAWMRDAGASHCVMEVSSHALELERTRGTDFQLGVFTNLGRDHLDFHKDLASYAAAKRLLFRRELAESRAADRTAVVNQDDPAAAAVIEGFSGRMLKFGFAPDADVRPLQVWDRGLDGVVLRLQFPGGVQEIESSLAGRHNQYNSMAAFACGIALGLAPELVAAGLRKAPPVPGRLERVPAAEGPAVFVDYAHTPEALEAVVATLRPMCRGRLWVVFGCGGDRDAGKRPLMGEIAAPGADRVVCVL